MWKVTVVLIAISIPVYGQTWISRARFIGYAPYFGKLIQETIYEVEKLQWSSFKIQDSNQTINLRLYNWIATGTAQYTNGFLVSIEKIDLTNIESLFVSRVVDGDTHAIGTIRGRIHFHNMKTGFDVESNLSEVGHQRHTVVFTHTSAVLECSVSMDMVTRGITTSTRVVTVDTVSRDLMEFRPQNNVSEVISRQYTVAATFNSFNNWGINIIAPKMKDIATNRLEFPTVMYI